MAYLGCTLTAFQLSGKILAGLTVGKRWLISKFKSEVEKRTLQCFSFYLARRPEGFSTINIRMYLISDKIILGILENEFWIHRKVDRH